MSQQLPSRPYVGWAGIISLFSGSIALLATSQLDEAAEEIKRG
jgi:hypothetical protein